VTITIQDDRTVDAIGRTIGAFRLRASHVVVTTNQDQPMPAVLQPAENIVEHVDGDLLQARALAGRHPGSPTAHARLASSEFGFGNRVSASNSARRVLQHDSFDAPALIVASQVFVALGDIDAAEQALDRVLESAAGDGSRRAAAALAARVAACRGEPERALELLAQGDGRAGSALKGAILAQMGRYHDAIRALRAALREVPDAPGTLCNLGYAYAAAGSIRKAIRATTSAAALDPADPTAGLNLVALLLSQDRASEAVAAIDRLTACHPGDIDLERSAAAVLRASGDTAGALRRLRRLKATKAARDAAPARREELHLDIALLDSPLMTPSAAFAAASEALKRCEYRSETIALVLASAALSTENLPTLEAAYTELRKHHDRSALLAVESRVAFLRLEFDRCVDAALEWARREPFSPEAHINASYMLSLHAGDYRQAARVGQAAIARGIRSAALRNNVAFALAMDAKPDEAARVLPDPSECELALATAGLIEAARGNLDRGIAMYEDCAEHASRSGEHDLAGLVLMHRTLAEVVAGLPVPKDQFKRFADRTSTDPRFAILHNAIAREQERPVARR